MVDISWYNPRKYNGPYEILLTSPGGNVEIDYDYDDNNCGSLLNFLVGEISILDWITGLDTSRASEEDDDPTNVAWREQLFAAGLRANPHKSQLMIQVAKEIIKIY